MTHIRGIASIPDGSGARLSVPMGVTVTVTPIPILSLTGCSLFTPSQLPAQWWIDR
jgi:hypothetical protein